MARKIERWETLDVLKGSLVLLMVLGHSLLVWFLIDGETVIANSQLPYLIFPFGSLFVPLIVCTAGTSTYYWLKKNPPFRTIALRSCMAVVIGIFLNLVVWGIEDMFDWDVLAFFAACLLLSYFLLKLHPIALYTSGIIALFIGPFLRELFSHYPYTYIHIIFLGDILGENYWPIIPWFGLFVAGYAVGEWREKINLKYLAYFGTIFIAISARLGELFFTFDASNIWGSHVFIASWGKVIGLIGTYFVIIPIIDYTISKRKLGQTNPIKVFSYGILPIYVFHIVVGYPIIQAIHGFGIFLLIPYVAIMFIASYAIGYWFMRKKLTQKKELFTV